MAHVPDPEFERLDRELRAARAADVPSIPEILACRQRFIRHLAQLVREYVLADQVKPRQERRLRVIDGDARPGGSPRGICSPIKTRELRDFEERARQVFGNIEPGTTAWRPKDAR